MSSNLRSAESASGFKWREGVRPKKVAENVGDWEMEKAVWLLTVGMLMALGESVYGAGSSDNGNQASCTYAIEIETTCAPNAGTTDSVSLRFGDSGGTDVLVRHLNHGLVRRLDRARTHVLDDVIRRPFHDCGVDVFQAVGPCVRSAVCYLYVKQLVMDSWRPVYVHVRVLGNPSLSSSRLYYRTYLPPHVWNGQDMCDKVVTHFGIRHV